MDPVLPGYSSPYRFCAQNLNILRGILSEENCKHTMNIQLPQTSSESTRHPIVDTLAFADSADAVLSNGQVITVLDLRCFLQSENNGTTHWRSWLPMLPQKERRLVVEGRTAAYVTPGMNIRFESDSLPLDFDQECLEFCIDDVRPLKHSLVPFREFSASIRLVEPQRSRLEDPTYSLPDACLGTAICQ